MEISTRDFICRSSLDEPKTATYGEYALVSAGEGGNRYMYILHDGEEVGFFWVDTHCYWEGCFVHDVRGEWSDILTPLLNETGHKPEWCGQWDFHGWDSVNDFIERILREFKSNRKSLKGGR